MYSNVSYAQTTLILLTCNIHIAIFSIHPLLSWWAFDMGVYPLLDTLSNSPVEESSVIWNEKTQEPFCILSERIQIHGIPVICSVSNHNVVWQYRLWFLQAPGQILRLQALC